MQNTKGEWRSLVKRFLTRRSFINYGLSEKIVDVLGYPNFYGPNKTVVLDIYSGTAVFSAALQNHIQPHRHVLMEPFPVYSKLLSSLERRPEIYYDEEDPFRWSAFQNLVKNRVYEPQIKSRDHVHNAMLFTANLLHAQGEQLVTQYLNCVTNQNWIQRFGRVRLLLWMRAATAEKLLAGPGEMARHRLSCQRESCCDARVVLHKNPKHSSTDRVGRAPYPKVLQSPLISTDEIDLARDFTKAVPDVSLIELTPHEHQVEHVDEFEYVVKNLCMLKGTPLAQSLNALGPGAVDDLSPQLSDLLNVKPDHLHFADFQRITDVFVRWPFKPEHLHDFYESKSLMGGSTFEE